MTPPTRKMSPMRTELSVIPFAANTKMSLFKPKAIAMIDAKAIDVILGLRRRITPNAISIEKPMKPAARNRSGYISGLLKVTMRYYLLVLLFGNQSGTDNSRLSNPEKLLQVPPQGRDQCQFHLVPLACPCGNRFLDISHDANFKIDQEYFRRNDNCQVDNYSNWTQLGNGKNTKD